jgi:hypothetical protein
MLCFINDSELDDYDPDSSVFEEVQREIMRSEYRQCQVPQAEIYGLQVFPLFAGNLEVSRPGLEPGT